MTTDYEIKALTDAFEAGDIDPANFDHAKHVQVAFGLLSRHDFIDAASIYAKGIRTLATNAGAPKKFNMTITYAFLSVIAERLAGRPDMTFDAFASAN